MSDIKPRIVDGVGLCDAGCPQADSCGDYTKCLLVDMNMWRFDEVCPVWAARLRAKVAALEEDKARVDWIASRGVLSCGIVCINDGVVSSVGQFEWDDRDGPTLRAAIDAARKGE